MLRSGHMTDKGRQRDHNEDAALVLPALAVFAVADGVGGHNAGELASHRAVDEIERRLTEDAPAPPPGGAAETDGFFRERFAGCLSAVNADILAHAGEDARNAGMATTLVLAHVAAGRLYVLNVGDSRAYLLRDGTIRQITEDHTEVNRMVSAGELTPEEARVHPRKNVITRALGAEKTVSPDFFATELARGDRVLLCSDGLHGELSDEEIQSIGSADGEPDALCHALVEAANLKGGRDNITVIMLEMGETTDI